MVLRFRERNRSVFLFKRSKFFAVIGIGNMRGTRIVLVSLEVIFNGGLFTGCALAQANVVLIVFAITGLGLVLAVDAVNFDIGLNVLRVFSTTRTLRSI